MPWDKAVIAATNDAQLIITYETLGANVYRLAILLIALLMPSFAWASSAGYGNVSGIVSQDGGKTFFVQSGNRSARPACATADRWVFNLTNAGGPGMMATILTAYSLGKPVTVLGTGTCDVWPDTETTYYVILP